MKIYVLKTEVKDQYLRFFEATTINPKSYISVFLKDTIRKLEKVDCPELGSSFKQGLVENGLEFLSNVLCLHTVFSYLSDEQKE